MAPYFTHRTEILIGPDGVEKLAGAHVLIVGVGGVGGYTAEALCRAGIGEFTLVDPDVIAPSNANRQIMALTSTMGRRKVEVMAERMEDIHPGVKVEAVARVLKPDDLGDEHIPWDRISYCVDAIDDVPAKVALLATCIGRDIPVVSAMGAGNSLDHTFFEVADISQTHHCPLAKAVRLGLRKQGYTRGVKVVYKPVSVASRPNPCGTISYVPAILGLMIAGEVIQDLL